jgi:hypothetical protein
MSARPFRLAALAPFALVAALVLAPAASASSGPKCHIDSQYGSTCIDLTGSGLRLQDVQAYYSPPNRDYLSHHKWALRITRYPCNPIGKTQRECRSTKRWLTRTRKRNPPHQGQNCVVFEPYGIGVSQCQDFGLAYAAASHGDFRGFYRMPHQFKRSVWFCADLVVRVRNHWRPNGAAGTPGARGCAQVHD